MAIKSLYQPHMRSSLDGASTASSTHNFQLELPDFSDIEISYDMANQAFRFTQTEESKVNQLYISTGDQVVSITRYLASVKLILLMIHLELFVSA